MEETDIHGSALSQWPLSNLLQVNSSHISCLYPEILVIIFSFLDVRDKGRAAQVCVQWRDAAYVKSVWRGAVAKLHLRKANSYLIPSLVRRGIRKVQILSLRRSLRNVIHGMQNIESLDLSGCYNITDSGISSAFHDEVASLKCLNLSLCKQITDGSLYKISQALPNLEHLDLGGCCNVTNAGLNLISIGLKKLKTLNLRSCWHISDSGIASVAGLGISAGNTALEHLGLQDCQKLSDDSLKHLASGLLNLKSINLSFCVTITDSGLKYLSKMTSLRELNLRSCDNISDTGMAYLAEAKSKLVSLDVSFCDKVDDQALFYIAKGLVHLKSLSLSACPVSDSGLVRVAETLTDLETLNVGQCSRLTDEAMVAVAENLRKLRCVDLYGCTKITTWGLERIMKLPQLSVLNLGLWHIR